MKKIRTSATIVVNPDSLVPYPLSKERIAIFNSGLVTAERYRRDKAYMDEASPESCRIDLGWGAEWMPWTQEVVEFRKGENPDYNFEETDKVAKAISASPTRPYFSYCYVPKACRPDNGDWRTMAEDNGRWVGLVRDYINGQRERGVEVGYHEIYNEPDLRNEQTGDATFYTGDVDDYIELYTQTSRAIREVDPSVRIGGPALASPEAHADWLARFLEAVVERKLPLDFLSFHQYGTLSLETDIENVREVLSKFPQLRDVELHMNEYNAFPIPYPRGGVQDTVAMAVALASDLPVLLKHRELSKVHWAQFLDSGNDNYSGMVDIDGSPKSVFDVYSFYQRMPYDRISANVDGPDGVGAIASKTLQGKIAFMIWNRHFAKVDTVVSVPGGERHLKVELLEGGEKRITAVDVRADSDNFHLRLPQGSVALISEESAMRTKPLKRVGWGITLSGSSAKNSWSDFDESSLSFSFGTNSDNKWTYHAAEIPISKLNDAKISRSCTANGKSCHADVAMRIEDSEGSVTQKCVSGEAVPDWTDVALPERLVPKGFVRCVVAARSEQHAFVRVNLTEV